MKNIICPKCGAINDSKEIVCRKCSTLLISFFKRISFRKDKRMVIVK